MRNPVWQAICDFFHYAVFPEPGKNNLMKNYKVTAICGIMPERPAL